MKLQFLLLFMLISCTAYADTESSIPDKEARFALELHDPAQACFNVEIETLTAVDVHGYLDLCRIYLEKDDYEKAVTCTYKARKLEPENTLVQFFLGYLHFLKKVKNPDRTQAFKLITPAAQEGYIEAIHLLGTCYFHGEGTKAHYGKAYEWLSKIEKYHIPEVDYILSVMYYWGLGVERDRAHADVCRRYAAFKGHYFAMKDVLSSLSPQDELYDELSQAIKDHEYDTWQEQSLPKWCKDKNIHYVKSRQLPIWSCGYNVLYNAARIEEHVGLVNQFTDLKRFESLVIPYINTMGFKSGAPSYGYQTKTLAHHYLGFKNFEYCAVEDGAVYLLPSCAVTTIASDKINEKELKAHKHRKLKLDSALCYEKLLRLWQAPCNDGLPRVFHFACHIARKKGSVDHVIVISLVQNADTQCHMYIADNMNEVITEDSEHFKFITFLYENFLNRKKVFQSSNTLGKKLIKNA